MQGSAHPAQTPLLPWRAGQLAKAIHVLQSRETAGCKTLSDNFHTGELDFRLHERRGYA